MVNQRQMYQTTNGIYAIWSTGHLSSPEWMIRSSTDLDAGKFTFGFIASNEDARCPHFGNASTEWWGSKWLFNTDLAVTCIGKTSFL